MVRKTIVKIFYKIELIKKKVKGFFSRGKKKKSFAGFSGKNNKTYLTANETLELNSQNKQDNLSIRNQAKIIIKEYKGDPEKILNYIKNQGTPVIKVKYAEKVLTFLKEDEGFIYPQKGIRALILSIAVNVLSSDKKIKIGLKTPEIFFMRNQPANFYFLAHQFYHWMSFKNNLDNFDENALYHFKNVASNDLSDKDISNMSLTQILSMKDAISRDVEAIEFVKEITKELIGSKNALNKLKQDKSINI